VLSERDQKSESATPCPWDEVCDENPPRITDTALVTERLSVWEVPSAVPEDRLVTCDVPSLTPVEWLSVWAWLVVVELKDEDDENPPTDEACVRPKLSVTLSEPVAPKLVPKNPRLPLFACPCVYDALCESDVTDPQEEPEAEPCPEVCAVP